MDELTNFDDGAYDPASEEDEGEPPLSGSVFDNTYAPIVEQSTAYGGTYGQQPICRRVSRSD